MQGSRSLAWYSAMLPHLDRKHHQAQMRQHDQFVFGEHKPKALQVRAWTDAWDRVDRALAANKTRRPA